MDSIDIVYLLVSAVGTARGGVVGADSVEFEPDNRVIHSVRL